ncbi:MAG TPA: YceI family protein [Chitinophagaceae bacterium]|nr:YceI family protein [Chitinophagaceae bacterium]
MKLSTSLLLGILLILTNNSQAQNNYTLSTYTVTIDGTSNLHNWDEIVGNVSGKGVVKLDPNKNFTLQSFNIVMQVNSIRSKEGSIMNNKTYKALKSDRFPEIVFALTGPVVSIPSGASSNIVNVTGNLTIAGVTKPISLPVDISEDSNKKITIKGTQLVKMTDYGVHPPTALFGVLKTGNNITIKFNITFLFVS